MVHGLRQVVDQLLRVLGIRERRDVTADAECPPLRGEDHHVGVVGAGPAHRPSERIGRGPIERIAPAPSFGRIWPIPSLSWWVTALGGTVMLPG
jgi:hypothetical protein